MPGKNQTHHGLLEVGIEVEAAFALVDEEEEASGVVEEETCTQLMRNTRLTTGPKSSPLQVLTLQHLIRMRFYVISSWYV
jgi:hypothetical protein